MDNEVKTVLDIPQPSSDALQNPITSNRIIKFAILVALLSVIALTFMYGLSWKAALRVKGQIAALEKQLVEQKQTSQILSRQVSDFHTNVKQQQQALQQLQQLNPDYNTRQTLAEIEHLLREALLNLNYQHNIPAAILLLQMADQRTISLAVPGIDPLRQLLASNITALQMLPVLDLEGILAKLNALQKQIVEAPLFMLAPTLSGTAEALPANKNMHSNWREDLNRTWASLQKIIIIRHRTTPVQPLLAPEQHLFLQQNLQLILQQTAWALMQRQDAMYQNSLQRAIGWIQQYYTANSAASTGMLEILQSLQKISLQPTLPDLEITLQATLKLQQALAGVSLPSASPIIPHQKNNLSTAAKGA